MLIVTVTETEPAPDARTTDAANPAVGARSGYAILYLLYTNVLSKNDAASSVHNYASYPLSFTR